MRLHNTKQPTAAGCRAGTAMWEWLMQIGRFPGRISLTIQPRSDIPQWTGVFSMLRRDMVPTYLKVQLHAVRTSGFGLGFCATVERKIKQGMDATVELASRRPRPITLCSQMMQSTRTS
jgi:hypothetical protein